MDDEFAQLLGQPKRVASTISFPYSDISDALAVCEAALKGGGLALSRDQLAAAMGLASGGGGFATKVATAKLFGVIESQGGKYALTDLGHEIVDPGRRSEAMVRAFLEVELYRKVYEEFRSKRLPPRPAGLEAAFVTFGVSPKNARAARLVFDKSARAAGFFPNGDEDRLVEPLIVPAKYINERLPDMERELENENLMREATAAAAAVSRAAPAPVGIHKSILGMLDELPPPKANWSKAEQADWLDAVATLFQVIYKSEDRGEISVTFRAASASF